MQARSLRNFELETLEGKLQEVTNDDGNTISGARKFWIIKPHTMVVVTTDEKGCFHAPVDNLLPGMRQIQVGEVLAQVDSPDNHIYISEA